MTVVSEQGTTYAKFVDDGLEQERKRREALDTRGIAILTTSSSFVTFVLLGAALILGKDRKVGPNAIWLVSLALLAFLVAAIVGLFANKLLEYTVTDGSGYTMLLTTSHWHDSEVTARNITSQLKVSTLVTLRVGNNKKASKLTTALAFQIAGIALLVCGLLRESLSVLGVWK